VLATSILKGAESSADEVDVELSDYGILYKALEHHAYDTEPELGFGSVHHQSFALAVKHIPHDTVHDEHGNKVVRTEVKAYLVYGHPQKEASEDILLWLGATLQVVGCLTSAIAMFYLAMMAFKPMKKILRDSNITGRRRARGVTGVAPTGFWSAGKKMFTQITAHSSSGQTSSNHHSSSRSSTHR